MPRLPFHRAQDLAEQCSHGVCMQANYISTVSAALSTHPEDTTGHAHAVASQGGHVLPSASAAHTELPERPAEVADALRGLGCSNSDDASRDAGGCVNLAAVLPVCAHQLDCNPVPSSRAGCSGSGASETVAYAAAAPEVETPACSVDEALQSTLQGALQLLHALLLADTEGALHLWRHVLHCLTEGAFPALREFERDRAYLSNLLASTLKCAAPESACVYADSETNTKLVQSTWRT